MLQTLLAQVTSSPSQSATEYFNLYTGATAWSTTESERQILIPAAGRLDNFMFLGTTSPGTAPNAYSYTVLLNGVATNLNVNVVTGQAGVIDREFVVDVVPGDLLSLRSIPNDTPNQPGNSWASLSFHPTAVDTFIMPGGNGFNDLTNGGTLTFSELQGGTYSTDATIVNSIVPMNATLKHFRVKLSGSPGVGTTYTFSVYKNNAQEASSVITVSDSATENNVDLNISFAPGDLIKIAHQATAGTPTARKLYWGTVWEPSTKGKFFIHFNQRLSSLQSDATQRYIGGHHSSAIGYFTTQSSRLMNVGPHAHIAKDFYMQLDTAPGGSENRTFTLRRDGINTNIAVSLNASDVNASDTTNSEIFSALDFLGWTSTTTTSTPAATTLRQAMTMEVMTAPDVFDTVTVSENIRIVVGAIVIEEPVTVTENITLQIPILYLSVNDAITVTDVDDIFPFLVSINVNDTVAVDSILLPPRFFPINLFILDQVFLIEHFSADPFRWGHDTFQYKPRGSTEEDTGLRYGGEEALNY